MAGIFDVNLNVAKEIVSDTKEKLTPQRSKKRRRKKVCNESIGYVTP
jgi:hypothetical protein